MQATVEQHDRLAGERVLLTGAGAFVGAHLLPALAATGAEVIATVRRGRRLGAGLDSAASVHGLDLTDSREVAALLDETRPSLVINLAAGPRQTDTPPLMRQTLADTLGVAASLIEHCPEAGARRLIHLGSATEYGPADEPLVESMAPVPQTWFGAVKAATTELCLGASRSGRIPVAVLRAFSVYGPHDKNHRLIPRAIAAARAGRELPLTSGVVRRDWIYVGDVVEACLLALDGRADGEVVNLATGVEHSNEEVVRAVGEAVGRPVRIAVGAEPERPWDRPHWSGSTAKAERVLGWRADTDLQAGLERTVGAERAVVG